jgi:hypothetical protein
MSHRHTTLAAVLGLALVAAPAAQAQTPTTTDRDNAAKQCKALRTAAGSAEAFRSTVATTTKAKKVTLSNAYGKCVSFYAKDEAQERTTARNAAQQACKAERDAATTKEAQAAFAAKYGAKNTASAYGKCVSSAAKAKKADADEQDAKRVNAAKACKTERGTTDATRAAFDAKYRTFGSCVSQRARAQQQTRS